MLNSGKKKILTLVLSEKKFLNETKNHNPHLQVKWSVPNWFQRRRFLNIFPIESYVKTMSADGGHLGWTFGSLDIILKVDHLRTIHAMFALN